MKRYFLLAAAAVAVMASCSKKGIEQPAGGIDDNAPAKVQFSLDAPSLVVSQTKGIGSVDEWNKQPLYILGYENTVTDYKNAEALIPNVPVEAPAGGLEDLLDLKQQTDGEYGVQMEPYYYASNSVYNFYGYYVDDAVGARDQDGNPTPTYGADVTWDLIINGTQDIMAAKANPVLDAAKAPAGNVKVSQTYSAYAARRGVHPTLKFNHLLTRFNFYIVAGSKAGETTYVTSIEMESKTEATLKIAPNVELNAKTGAELSYLKLMQRTAYGDNLVALDEQFPYADAAAGYEYDYEDLKQNGNGKIGESIMVISGEASHKIRISTRFDKSNLTMEPTVVTLNASDIIGADGKKIEKFAAGCQYDVILTIYGPEEVKITAVLTPWEEGGYAVIDPDADGPFAVSKVSVVTDEQSYNLLPQAYLETYPWDTYKDSILNGENPLPWIAFEVTKEQALEVVANEVATGYSKSLSFPAEVNKIGLLTLSAKELGVEELKGEWIITINDIPKIVNFE